MQYILPKELFDELLVKNIGKESAIKFANAIEKFLEIIQNESNKIIIEKKENIKAEIYNELRNGLVTKEFVRAEMKKNNLLLKILIGISIFALTIFIFNPNFVNLIEKIFR